MDGVRRIYEKRHVLEGSFKFEMAMTLRTRV
jgi:hypothetical protein